MRAKNLKLVGLISDTHIPSRAKTVPNEVFEIFDGVNLILHAGDLTQLSVVDELQQLAPVVAVSGNMDACMQSVTTIHNKTHRGIVEDDKRKSHTGNHQNPEVATLHFVSLSL